MERGAEERQRYLAQVRQGRYDKPPVDRTGPRYTVAAEEQRQAQALGLGGEYAARQAAGTQPMDPAAQRDAVVEALMAQGRTTPVEAPVPMSPPGGWNPFAGGVHGPAGQVVGAGADAMATMGRWLREQLPNRMPSWGARPAPLQSMPGYNRDENAQLQDLERGR